MTNELLGGKPAPQAPKEIYVEKEYPKGLHHPVYGCRIVFTPEQAAALLEDGWYSTPADFPPAPEPEAAGPTVAEMQARFDAAWKKLNDQHDDLQAARANLQKENAQLIEENHKLTTAAADLRKQVAKITKAAAKPAEEAKK